MKKFIVIFFGFLLAFQAFARGEVRVNGYHRANGTYVQSHYRTAPDGVKSNNWSHYGNVNPYTGRVGTNRDSVVGYSGPYTGYISNPYKGHNEKTSQHYTVD